MELPQWFLGIWLLSVGLAAAASYRHDFDGDLEMGLYLGTPAQGPLRVGFHSLLMTGDSAASLELPTSAGYDPSASSTFTSANNSDIFRLTPNGPRLPPLDVRMLQYPSHQKPFMDLSFGENGTQKLVDAALAALGGDPTIVIVIISSEGTAFDGHHVGSIYLGDANPKICRSKWTDYPSRAVNPVQMAFYSTEVQIGRFRQTGKIPLAIASDVDFIRLESQLYNAAVKELNVDPKSSRIDCNQKEDIMITFEGSRWVIEPEQYIQASFFGRLFNNCYFKMKESPFGVTTLPLERISRRCLRYNFEKKTVSMTKLTIKRPVLPGH